jgi:hypothetical protein
MRPLADWQPILLIRETRCLPAVASAKAGNQWFEKLMQNFPRNLTPDFTHYLSERPEMSSQRREVTEGQNNQRKLKQ